MKRKATDDAREGQDIVPVDPSIAVELTCIEMRWKIRKFIIDRKMPITEFAEHISATKETVYRFTQQHEGEQTTSESLIYTNVLEFFKRRGEISIRDNV